MSDTAFANLPRLDITPGQARVLGTDLLNQAQFEHALELFHAAIAAEPDNIQAAHAIGICQNELGLHEQALTWFHRAKNLIDTELIALLLNRGKALGDLGRTDEAHQMFDTVLRQDPNNALAIYNRGLMAMQRGAYRFAIADFDRALVLEPDNAKALFGRGFANLVLGNYEDGFRDYEHRLKDLIAEPNAPLWDGTQSLQGKTILVHGEQGHGDDIMFMRFVPLMVDRGANVLLVLHPGVRPLFEGMPGTTMLDENAPTWPPFDYWVRMMSLARCFAVTASSVPPPAPITLTAAERQRMPWPDGDTSFKVGLVWSGSPQSRYDKHRSIPLAQLEPLVLPKKAGVRFFSLQLGVRDSDREAFERFPITDVTGVIENFRDTAAAITNLDMVVTVDTAMAHLAGSMGIPTCVMLTAFRTYWLWIQDRTSSPWYPSVKVFRQKTDGEWGPVVEAVREALVAR